MRPSIKHVVVLMLENRSFDHVLGWLKLRRPELNGLTGHESNAWPPWVDERPAVFVTQDADIDECLSFDPPHEFEHVQEQIFGWQEGGVKPPYQKLANMSGFLSSSAWAEAHAPRVMAGFAPGTLPAIHTLAEEFAICDAWFSSVPGPTWPNRFFAHCGTAGGYVDGNPRVYAMPSVFQKLTDAGRSWRVYYHDVPQAMALAHMPLLALSAGLRGGMSWFSTFLKDAAKGTLPSYTFIEPNYYNFALKTAQSFWDPSSAVVNDQHPPASMRAGDDLVRTVYEALRNGPHWERTLLLVVWDEHGGFYDHVPPPSVPSPDAEVGQREFRFDRLGPRVPAIVVSPFIKRGALDSTVREHSSIPATLRSVFGIDALTVRDREAAPFDSLLTLNAPRDTPLRLPHAKQSAIAKASRARQASPPPPTALHTSFEGLFSQIEGNADALAALSAAVSEGQTTTEEAPSIAQDALSSPQNISPLVNLRAAPLKPRRSSQLSSVVPDAIDLRDRPFTPSVSKVPPLTLKPPASLREPLDQEETSACTGFALAALINHLFISAGREGLQPVSPRMLYSMARRYDEWPESRSDSGSSVRGALKGWFRHGVCALERWGNDVPLDQMPDAHLTPELDWWRDALRRPLGAYYRVDKDSLSDLQAALNETGAIFVSARAHAGWEQETKEATNDTLWTIPFGAHSRPNGAHAFLLVGYDEDGFIVLNSWSTRWGSRGLARLSYSDWRANGMDAWVAQLGVATREHLQVAASRSLVMVGGNVELPADSIVRAHAIAPFLLNAGNNGLLSRTGAFRTSESDVDFLLTQQLTQFRQDHGLPENEPVDVAICLHGGMVSEQMAADGAGSWVAALYARKVFPIFVMWKSDLKSTWNGLLEDKLGIPAGVTWESLKKSFIDNRIEQLAGPLLQPFWKKMKANATALSRAPKGVLRYVFDEHTLRSALRPSTTRLHLIGHSAGAIAAAELANWLINKPCGEGEQPWTVNTLVLLASALRVDRFRELIEAPLLDERIGRLHSFVLNDALERTMPSMPYYSKSVLYLVARALEDDDDDETPLLGMARHASTLLTTGPLAKHVDHIEAPGPRSDATTHAAFAFDEKTLSDIIDHIAR